MERQDTGMAYLLQYENVAWYENGTVSITDRRFYPYKKEKCVCKSYEEVAQAIADMVTQSGGPYLAAGMGMALAGWQCRELSGDAQLAFLEKAAYVLSHARPTTSAKMQLITGSALEAAKKAMAEGKNIVQAMFDVALDDVNNRYAAYKKVASYLVEQFPANGAVMTQCFAETILGTMLLECRAKNKTPRFLCPETRPYLQGARLTASVISDMGFDVHVITDNMPAYLMKREQVEVFTSAADVITMDGYIVNKVGTFQIALAAQYWGIPYFVTGSPNAGHSGIDTVTIEERDHTQVTDIMGVRVVEPNVKAYYPAFDIVPPKLCSGVVTQKGIYSPYDLQRYFKD
ncbi:MAG: s-methyl-5-thioribose-1-phosphate isomerase [Hydrogenoanaerobacterium sp.]